MSSQKYPEYKDSHISWLGEIPSHWHTKALKHLVSEPITDGPHETPQFFDDGIPFVSAEAVSSGKIDFGKIRGFISPEDHAKYSTKYKPQRNDIFMIKSGATTGIAAIVDTDEEFNIWSPLAAIRCAETMNSFFVLNFIKSKNFQEAVTLYWSFGTQQNIGMGVIENLSVTVPPLEEQSSIAAFLDRETAKIDALVAEQEKLIELLKEKRQAVISHAVTKGLDPNAPMKDSGVEWLGEVPEHWVITTLGRITLDKCDGPFGSGLKSEHYTDEGVRVIRLQNIRDGWFDGTDEAFIDETYYFEKLTGHGVEAADVLIAGLGDDRNSVGRACVAPDDIQPALVKADCFRFRVDSRKAVPSFLAHQLTAGAPVDAGRMSSGSTRSRINLSTMATRKVALPSLSEQCELLEWFDSVLGTLGALIHEAQRAIELLKERRAALISAAVTGKIDVRGLAGAV